MNPLNPTNLDSSQISAAFTMVERPVKRLLRDYFVQFDRESVRNGNGPRVIEDEVERALRMDELPQDYIDMGGMLKLIHGDESKNEIDTSLFKPDSLLKIPASVGHLTVPQKRNDDGTTTLWGMDLHLRKPSAKFDYEMLKTFAKDAPDPDAAAKTVRELIIGFVPSSIFIFNLLKSKNEVMQTLRLNCTGDAIYIEDARCVIVPNRVLIVRLAKKGDELLTDE